MVGSDIVGTEPGQRNQVDICLRCHQVLKSHHCSVACDICDSWFHVGCVAKETAWLGSMKFMCLQCREQGFIGSTEASWYFEKAGDVLRPSPPQSGSSSHSESDADEHITERGIGWGKVEYDNGAIFLGELRDGDEYIGSMVSAEGKKTYVKFVNGRTLRILWEDVDYRKAQEAEAQAGISSRNVLMAATAASDSPTDDDSAHIGISDTTQKSKRATAEPNVTGDTDCYKNESSDILYSDDETSDDESLNQPPKIRKLMPVLDHQRGARSKITAPRAPRKVPSKLAGTKAVDVIAEVRSRIRSRFSTALSPATDHKKCAEHIEAALWSFAPPTGASDQQKVSPEYRKKAKDLYSSLSDDKNAALKQRVLTGELSTEEFVKMSADQLANEEERRKREAATQAKLYHSVKVRAVHQQPTADIAALLEEVGRDADAERRVEELKLANTTSRTKSVVQQPPSDPTETRTQQDRNIVAQVSDSDSVSVGLSQAKTTQAASTLDGPSSGLPKAGSKNVSSSPTSFTKVAISKAPSTMSKPNNKEQKSTKYLAQSKTLVPPVPDGFDQAKYSENRKTWFFVSRRTGKKQWATEVDLTKAIDGARMSVPAVPPGQKPSQRLTVPAGFDVARFSKKHKKWYFWQRATGTKRWATDSEVRSAS